MKFDLPRPSEGATMRAVTAEGDRVRPSTRQLLALLPEAGPRVVAGLVAVAVAQVTVPLAVIVTTGTVVGRVTGGPHVASVTGPLVVLAGLLAVQQVISPLVDEPTSGLDADAEHALFERYAAAAAGAASAVGAVTVRVSHRFSTVRLADRIVVVDGGRVVEEGGHAELVAAGGLYAELYGLQASAYR